VFIAGLASPGLSLGWRITICGVGCLFVLLAIGLPRRLAREAVRAFDAHSRKARREHDTATASQLLRNAADELSSLPTRDIGEVPGLGVFALVKKSFTLRKAMATYRRKHQAATVYAVETGLSAGAKDSGALQLAQSAANNTDLLALEVELFRMALELSPSI
jgi:hypothetical protein